MNTQRDRWDQLCERVGGFERIEQSGLAFEMLTTMYTNPPRTYHDLAHIESCMAIFDEVRRLADAPDAIEFALWLHDCIFFAVRPDNEVRSADAAAMIAALLGCDAVFVTRVKMLILDTSHRRPPTTPDGGLISDIDLTILGAPWDEYNKYRLAIREEFGFASDADFRNGRGAFLERMLDRDTIYNTPYMRLELEERARANLSREADIIHDAQ